MEKEELKQSAEQETEEFHHPEAYWRALSQGYKEKLRCARAAIDDLKKSNLSLRTEFKTLQDRQAVIHPPIWVKPNLSLHREVRCKKPGPKVGHTPHWRRVPDDDQVDRHITIAPKQCPKCQCDLTTPSTWHPHTQLDIPPENKTQITRFYIGYPYCRCCRKMVSLPLDQRQGLIPFGKYGPRFHGYVSYWKFGLGLTLGKIKKKLKDEYQVEVSTGELSEILHNTAKSLDFLYQELAKMIRIQECIYVDETGWRLNGDNFFLWSFSNEKISYYRIQKSRGSKLPTALLGKEFSGILVSDFYSAYNSIQCRKQKCWVHIIREVRDLNQKYPDNVEFKLYLKHMKNFYHLGVVLQKRYQQGKDIYLAYCKLRQATDKWSFRVWNSPDLNRLGSRLKKHRAALYTFIYENIDGTNNRAERELRPAVLMRKVSHGNRSNQGAHTLEVVLSVVRTCLRNKINYIDLTAKALTGQLNGH